MSAAAGAFPIPTPYLPDYNKDFNNPKVRLEFLQGLQDGLEAMRLQIGNNSSTTAPTALTGLYSGTWADYTGTAGYIPVYSKSGGLVVLEGAVTNGGGVFLAGTIITLPVGFRPATTNQFLCLAVGGSPGVQTTGPVVVQVAATGVVSFVTGMTGGGLTNNMYYINLAGIVFKAAA